VMKIMSASSPLPDVPRVSPDETAHPAPARDDPGCPGGRRRALGRLASAGTCRAHRTRGPVMPDAAQDPGSVFRLMYRSHSLIPAGGRKAELGLLFTQARSQNKARGLTGALLVSDDWFVQVLEGEEQTVRALFARIE